MEKERGREKEGEEESDKSRLGWTDSTFDHTREKDFFGLWNKSFMPISVREIAFKFVNNRLTLNSNLSNMLHDKSIGGCLRLARFYHPVRKHINISFLTVN